MFKEKPVVLIVDDNKEIVEAIANFLQVIPDFKDKIFVKTAHYGKQAMQIIEQGSVDMVYSDIDMPNGGEGFDLAEDVKAFNQNILVVLNSGNVDYKKEEMPDSVDGYVRGFTDKKTLFTYINQVREKVTKLQEGI
ncbi:MAG TPA: response regulator [Candidatus Gracilibacteria bacterium]|nr:response regulator [Candidatus Gracilibacteria bacterium]